MLGEILLFLYGIYILIEDRDYLYLFFSFGIVF